MEAQAAKELAALNPPDTPPAEALAGIKRSPRPNKAAPPKAPKAKPGQKPSPRRRGMTAAADHTAAGSLSAVDMPLGEAIQEEELPDELTTSLAAWQQFQGDAKAMLLGKPQADNMVHFLQSQVEGKEPDRVTMEVGLPHPLPHVKLEARLMRYCLIVLTRVALSCMWPDIALLQSGQGHKCPAQACCAESLCTD